MNPQPRSHGGPDPSEAVPQPLVGRQRRLILALRMGVSAAGVMAAVGVLAPDPVGSVASRGFFGLVIAVPLLRVAWLTLRWINRRDLRFAAVGVGVLVVASAAAITAL